MHLFAPRQAASERRVVLTPDVVRSLVRAGHTISIATGAGDAAGFVDQAYREAGAVVVDAVSPAPTEDVDLVVTVGDIDGPSPAPAMLGLLEPFTRPERMTELAVAGTTVHPTGVPCVRRVGSVW